MEEHAVVRSLAALAQPVRLQVFRALVVAGERGMNPGTMSEGLGVAAATLSFHLKELSHAGLVTQERDGRHLIYRAAYDHMQALLGYLTENCCQGSACLAPPAPGRKC
ncbi:metalloregulator ArsR/SmtB family transcription factor [Methylibium sp.]|uniref:ArsR/SmtB family transcription factor n=1 Tax=Methylibium sp. TaxID=2067992 RepID=UPI00286CDD7F|nr:metalloregulator ArsR/SmtB family transcription factor [Methylibium sp.]